MSKAVNQPGGTRAQLLEHREPVSQGRPGQVSSSMKYQQLIVYLLPYLSLSLSDYPSISVSLCFLWHGAVKVGRFHRLQLLHNLKNAFFPDLSLQYARFARHRKNMAALQIAVCINFNYCSSCRAKMFLTKQFPFATWKVNCFTWPPDSWKTLLSNSRRNCNSVAAERVNFHQTRQLAASQRAIFSPPESLKQMTDTLKGQSGQTWDVGICS